MLIYEHVSKKARVRIDKFTSSTTRFDVDEIFSVFKGVWHYSSEMSSTTISTWMTD